MDIPTLGFTTYASKVTLPDGLDLSTVARVTRQDKSFFTLMSNEGEFSATVRGKFFESDLQVDFPRVGDWVIYSKASEENAIIESVLPRASTISRKEISGHKQDGSNKSFNQQIIVTNVDLMCVVQGLDNDFNLRRIERYLAIAQGSGCTPIIVLNKSDVVENPETYVQDVQQIAPGIPVFALSAQDKMGIDQLQEYLKAGVTAVFLGSSGAGKSTLTNLLLNSNVQTTGEVRADDSRGRHTTTHRELFILPTGGIIIDTPGMRELGVVNTESEMPENLFEAIQDLTYQCTYSSCDHDKSEGCAVREAIASGTIDEDQFTNYLKILKEKEFNASKTDKNLNLLRKQKIKDIHKEYYKKKNQNHDRDSEFGD